jgi:short-subunit dehydrogenase
MAIALITGASSGIGREFARQIKTSGEVDGFWLVARSRGKLEDLARELGDGCRIICADLGTDEGVDALLMLLEEEQPQVKYLINGAGYGVFGGYDELSEDVILGMIDLNVKALVRITHRVAPYMVKGGHIIQMGSGSCFTPLPYFNVYAAGKSFVLHYSKALKYEMKPKGISVTCFCPGWVDTGFLGIATNEDGVTAPKADSYKPLLKVEPVVRGALKAARRGRVMYVTNWYTKMQHMLFKLLPDRILTKLWMKRLVKGKK